MSSAGRQVGRQAGRQAGRQVGRQIDYYNVTGSDRGHFLHFCHELKFVSF